MLSMTAKQPISNPKEIYLNRQEQTFYIEDSLIPIPYWKEDGPNREPERLHDPQFSRYNLGIINRDGKRATYFIRSNELSDVAFRTKKAYEKELEAELTSASASPATTLRFVAGNLKGKTPLEVIAEQGEDVLISQRDYLAKQTKYQKKNAPLIAACDEAVKMFREGKTSGQDSLKPLLLYRMDFPFANPYRRDRNGFAQTRQMNITWNFGMEKPVDVHILECYAPTRKNGTDLETPVLSEAINRVDNHFNLSAAEWLEAVTCMETVKRLFENAIWADHHKAAVQFDKENKERAGSERPANNETPKQPQPLVGNNTASAPNTNKASKISTRELKCVVLKKGVDRESGRYCCEVSYGNGNTRKTKINFSKNMSESVFSAIKIGAELIADVFVQDGKCYCTALK